MRNVKRLYKALGKNEIEGINFPSKMSNVQLSRIVYGNLLGCSFCFPHGWETSNSTQNNNQRSWKKIRKKQYKE